MDYILTTNNLTKKYGRFTAVDSINLHVSKGDIYGFIGRNGAGKTTTLKILGGLSHPTSGDFTILGHTGSDLIANNIFSKVGILIEEPGIYGDMSAFNNIKMKCLCDGINDDNYIYDLLDMVGLRDVSKRKVKNFSLGMKQRLGIALAMVGNPEILVLDEPINGLDPQGIAEVRETILKLNKERGLTIIISSHILEELSKIATHYGIINNGKLISELTAKELSDKCESRIVIKTNEVQKAADVLTGMGITQFVISDASTIFVNERLDESAQIGMSLAKAEILVSSLSVESVNLEDFFFNITGGVQNA